jgi:hypothetical protein
MVGANEVADLILRTVQHLVDTPEAVTVRSISDEKGIRYQVRVANAEVGQVIGKEGKTAQSMRTILAAIAMKNKSKLSLEILSGFAKV